ncbi:MAG TPA: ChaN family lipoprotein [Flavobacterium sp.]|nr:ChaN family lipoprotein [Flavobacterium sp.]
MQKLITFFCLLTFAFSFSQDKPAYQLFDKNGKRASYKKLVKASLNSSVVLFGEHHDNPISHWLQLSLTKDLHKKHKSLIMGAEMLERDNQQELNQYLSSEIDQKGLDSLARLWNNYKTDYKPLVDYAKDHKIPFIATNIPRRYASMVFRGGFEALDTLSAHQKEWIAPLPIKYDARLSQYEKMLEMAQGHGGDKLPKAQAIKDATMAYSILSNLPTTKTTFIHYHGTYHSDFYEGIYWYLKQDKPTLRILTIATVSQSQLKKLDKEHLHRADFILVVDKDMTTTY